MKWVYVLLAILYTLVPYDLLPDFLAGIGWLDDLVVLGLLLRFLYLQYGRTRRSEHAGADGMRREKGGGGPKPADTDKESDRRFESADPYTVLGVDRSASEDHIKKAYREMVSRYHPDKVAHLGEEFRALAETRFKQIQHAYQKILQGRR